MNTSTYSTLAFDLDDDGVLRLEIDRADHLNAVNGDLHRELAQVFRDIADDDSVGAVVLTGRGRAFCAGGDLDWLGSMTPRQFAHLHRESRRIILDLLNLDQPVVAAVNGPAIGFGATLALYCDVVLMSQRAVIADAHVTAGLAAGDGGAAVWPWLIGMARAKELLLTGRRVSADEAAAMGLVTRAVEPDELDEQSMSLARSLATGPRVAIRATKRATNKLLIDAVNATLDLSLAYEGETFAHPDHAEAVAAIRGKRRPNFER
jgi:enoyl-CoA hydratase